MTRPALPQQVEEMVLPIAGRLGLEVVDVELLGQGPRAVLRVFVDGPEGVTVEECAQVSEALSRQLDLHDLIPHAYTLEVSSPGLDRPLKREQDFYRFAGRRVELRTVEPVEGQRSFKGRLAGLVDGQVTLVVEGRTIRIPRDRVALARLVVDMEDVKADLSRGGRSTR